MWFLPALVCILGWGFADLFYKKSTDESDRYSHLKIAVWVGLVMGAVSLLLILFVARDKDIGYFLHGIAVYAPASAGYIISMIIGYAGLRYLELSIVSPVQNASGALSAVCIIIWFVVTGRSYHILDELSTLDVIGTAAIVIGVIALAVVENKLQPSAVPGQSKFRESALALIFPILYCLFDTLGTAADGVILSEDAGLNLSEIEVLILYGLTFLLAGIVSFVFLSIKTKKVYNPFAPAERPKAVAALCEEFGQVFYIFAMADNPVLAAPLVSSYCIISVLLSRLLMKEKLNKKQYLCITFVILGILLLGISEGIQS